MIGIADFVTEIDGHGRAGENNGRVFLQIRILSCFW